jgi:hypothetical protein
MAPIFVVLTGIDGLTPGVLETSESKLQDDEDKREEEDKESNILITSSSSPGATGV